MNNYTFFSVKLTHEARRHYYNEPTPNYDVPSIVASTEPNAPTISGNKVNDIPKDTDELGDWLYNQFFKTIENQVISHSNNTKPNNNQKPPTRRSGGDGRPVGGSTKRLKTRRFGRGRKRKHNTKVRGLRRKLLRITEDDSLFDSESDSESSDSSGSSDSESDSDGSSEGSDGKKSGSGSDGEKDHGHKKVIIFNRRPKPPLPSFIFLPNMDTPYYPPIGLPPPPPMPMYPMVPVPPMGPPMFPFPGTKCDEENSTTTTIVTTTPTTAATNATEPEPEPEPETEPPPPPKDRRRSKLEKQNTHSDDDEDEDDGEFTLRASEPGKKTKFKQAKRNKLMKKLRQKMKDKRKKVPTNSDDESDLAANLDDVPNASDTLPAVKRAKFKKHEPQIPNLKDVDFKYLSELIHRVNNSAPRNKPPSPFRGKPPSPFRGIPPSLMPLPFDNNALKELQNLKTQQTRRNFDTLGQVPTRVESEVVNAGDQTRNLNKPNTDEEYYTNLGRQIASMIRNADTKSVQPFHTEQSRPVPFHSVLNENNYSPGSFWERSVRSPYPQISDDKQNTNYLDESRTLKHSNEKNLLNLENEVETYVSTAPSLSLQDLENLLNTVEKTKDQIKIKDPLTSPKHSNISLNVNLLPKYVKEDTINGKLYDPGNDDILNSADKDQAYLQPKSLANPNPSKFSPNVKLPPNYLRNNHNYRRLPGANNANNLNPEDRTRVYFQLKNSLTDPKSLNVSLNENFLPEYLRGNQAYRRLFEVDNADILNPAQKALYYFQLKKSLGYPNASNFTPNIRSVNPYRRFFGADNADILSPAQKAQYFYQFMNPLGNRKTSNVSLYANVLPEYLRGDKPFRKFFGAGTADILSPAQKAQYYYQLINSLGNPKSSNVSHIANFLPEDLRGDNTYRKPVSAGTTDILSPAQKAQYYLQVIMNSLGNPKTSNLSLNVKFLPEYLRGDNTHRKPFSAGNADILSPAQKAQYFYQLMNPLGNPKTSNLSLNVNFLPEYLRGDNTYSKPVSASNADILSPAQKAQYYFQLIKSLGHPNASNFNLNVNTHNLRSDNLYRRLFGVENADSLSPAQKTQYFYQLMNPLGNRKSSNVSLNVNILPEYLRGNNPNRKSYGAGNADILSPAQKAQYYFQLMHSLGNPKSSNVSLNVHLQPKYPKGDGDYRKFYDGDSADVANPVEKAPYYYQLKNPPKSPKISNVSLNEHTISMYAGDKPTYRRLVGNTGMLNSMENTQYYNQLKNSLGKPEPPNDSFNALMIPQYTRDSYRRLYGGDNADNQTPTHTPQPSIMMVEPKYITEQYQALYPVKFVESPDLANTSNKTMLNKTVSPDTDNNNAPQSSDYWMYNIHQEAIQRETETKSPVLP
ncbi:hypothetical protein SFRURICE_014032, partial [Spodoptera frugiperda]